MTWNIPPLTISKAITADIVTIRETGTPNAIAAIHGIFKYFSTDATHCISPYGWLILLQGIVWHR